MLSEPIPALLFALVLSAALTPLVIRAAHSSGILDVPNARSSHTGAIPRGGGIAVLVAAATAALAATAVSSDVIALVAGAVVLGGVGLLDDRFGLPAHPRLAAQITVPLLVGLFTIDQSGPALLAALFVATIWCAGYVNAFNFMDGINGISGSQAALAGVFLAFVARDVENQAMELASWAMTGAALGFLPFNAVRARIFLGDVGSYGIGFWLSATALLLWDSGVSPIVLLGPFLLYIADTSTVLLRRWRRGDSLFEAHREHAYQRLHQSGWSHLAVSTLCALITVVTSVVMLATIERGVGAQLLSLGIAALVVAGYLRFVHLRSASSLAATS